MPEHCVLPPPLATITRTVIVAAGRFAPGHLGELTPIMPFELVDAVLSETRTVQRRLRDLPSRVGVYFLLAMCLFPEVGYRLVWAKMTAGLSGIPVVRPSTKALRDLRRRLGSTPVRALFEVLAGPLARPTTSGVRFGPYRTVSFDGCSSIKVPDSERNREWLGRCPHGGYPQVELMTLVETGTRAVIAAVFGPTREGETSYATRLMHHLSPEMPVLWDRGFDSNDFLTTVHATGAQVLGRIRRRRRPVLQPLADSSYLSVIGGVPVRIIEAQVSITCTDGSTFEGSYRLATTLLDARRYPADRLVHLYHERWEHESAYYALRHTILHGRVLRSHDPAGVEQELWALLTLYQLLRRTMVQAAESQPGTDPDRCGFTIALQTARDLLVGADGIFEQGIGEIGRRLLSALSPARRARVSTRKVKSPISRYAERKLDGRPDASKAVTSTTITLLPPPVPEPALPTITVPQYVGPGQTSTRMTRVLAILQAEPERLWRSREIAELLGDVTLVATYRQLARWTEKGMIKRVRTGRYAAITQETAPLRDLRKR